MKTLKLSDEDYTMLATILAVGHPELFQRVYIPAAKRPHKEAKQLGLMGDDLNYFMAAWKAWPTEVTTKKWQAGVGYEKHTVLKGSRQMAMDNFLRMMSHASARQLYAAAIAYLTEAPSVKEGFIQNVATFYGPKKGTVLEWLDRAKEMIEEQDGRDGA